MKGKIAFVLGAAVGYVLGSRAGRERYEQIKRGARTVWNTPPVQRGVEAVQGVAQGQIDRLKDAAVQAGKNLLSGSGRGSAGSAAGARPVSESAPNSSSSGGSASGTGRSGGKASGSAASGGDAAGASSNSSKSGSAKKPNRATSGASKPGASTAGESADAGGAA